MTSKMEREATQFVDSTIQYLVARQERADRLQDYSLGNPIDRMTPGRIAELTVARLRRYYHQNVIDALCLHQLQQIARSRLNTHFHEAVEARRHQHALLQQAQALATVRPPAPLTMVQQQAA